MKTCGVKNRFFVARYISAFQPNIISLCHDDTCVHNVHHTPVSNLKMFVQNQNNGCVFQSIQFDSKHGQIKLRISESLVVLILSFNVNASIHRENKVNVEAKIYSEWPISVIQYLLVRCANVNWTTTEWLLHIMHMFKQKQVENVPFANKIRNDNNNWKLKLLKWMATVGQLVTFEDTEDIHKHAHQMKVYTGTWNESEQKQ